MATVREEKTKIINKALLRLRHGGFAADASSGDLDFTTPSNNSERIAKLVVDTFDDIVEEILEMIPWVHMSVIDDTLTQDSDYNTEFYTYAYQLPSDFVRLVGDPFFFGSPVHYSVAQWEQIKKHYQLGSYNSNGDRILETEFTTPGIRYVFLTTFSDPNADPDTYYTLMNRHLVQLIVARCRVEWGYGVTGELGIEEQMEQLFQLQLRKSRDHNNRELGKTKIKSDALNYARLRR